MLATTKMSSKGQIVIPKSIRERFNLAEGMQFLVTGKDDVVILKAISEPSLDEFEALILETRAQAKKVGLQESDISDAVKKARENK